MMFSCHPRCTQGPVIGDGDRSGDVPGEDGDGMVGKWAADRGGGDEDMLQGTCGDQEGAAAGHSFSLGAEEEEWKKRQEVGR